MVTAEFFISDVRRCETAVWVDGRNGETPINTGQKFDALYVYRQVDRLSFEEEAFKKDKIRSINVTVEEIEYYNSRAHQLPGGWTGSLRVSGPDVLVISEGDVLGCGGNSGH
jgi:hypothetical protein